VAVQTPERPAPDAAETEAGVIEDARARQRRHRAAAVALVFAIAATALLIIGFAGGGGSNGGTHANGNPGRPSAGSNAQSQPTAAGAATGLPKGVEQIGLLAPGVGWAANDAGFYMTRNGGRRWRKLRIPGLNGEILAALSAVATPTPTGLVVAFHSNAPEGICEDITVSGNSGQTWRTGTLPGCSPGVDSLSFVNAKLGFATAASEYQPSPTLLYVTRDGGRNWRQVGQIPLGGSITFTSARSGWGIAPEGSRFLNRDDAQKGATLYHTTDGGRTWREAQICRSAPHGTVAVSCQTPTFFGTQNGYVPAIVLNNKTKRGRIVVYATIDGGRSWSTREPPDDKAARRYATSYAWAFSAPNPKHLFILRGSYLYKSADGGAHWTSSPVPGFSDAAAVDFASDSYGWALEPDQRFEYTTDGGRHWQRFSARAG
jgi:photosystem II stability/assembly factor-like uncharacterized protein